MKEWTENARKVFTKHPSCVDVGECRPPHRGGKNTRRWCKGRVGIPHTWEWLRQRGDLEREQRYGMVYNRITERPVCFGCGKEDFRFRSYCAQCGEPWPQLQHQLVGGTGPRRRYMVVTPCARCGAPWMSREGFARSHGYVASGSVLR
jgi:hypothetical protein